MSDACRILILNGVIVQENGIIRNAKGYLIGHLASEIDFESEHLVDEPPDEPPDGSRLPDGESI